MATQAISRSLVISLVVKLAWLNDLGSVPFIIKFIVIVSLHF
jgi:hypothetical protein